MVFNLGVLVVLSGVLGFDCAESRSHESRAQTLCSLSETLWPVRHESEIFNQSSVLRREENVKKLPLFSKLIRFLIKD